MIYICSVEFRRAVCSAERSFVRFFDQKLSNTVYKNKQSHCQRTKNAVYFMHKICAYADVVQADA